MPSHSMRMLSRLLGSPNPAAPIRAVLASSHGVGANRMRFVSLFDAACKNERAKYDQSVWRMMLSS